MRSAIRLLVLGLLIVPLVVALTPIQAAPGSSAFGINSHIATRYPDPSSMAVPSAPLGELEVGWVREDFQFHRMSPEPNTYDWLFHDEAVDELTSRGINIIGVLNGPTPAWATGGNPGGAFFPPDPNAFANFAGAVVNRYKDRIRYWQVWNEPDNPLYWQPQPSAAAYTNLLRTTAQAIRAADPNARILAAGIVSPEPAATWLQMIADHGGWNSFDIVAIHPYTDPLGPEEGQIGPAGVGQVKALVDRLGTKPIWATEFGWSTGPGGRGGVAFSDADQANFLVRASVLLRAAGVERVIWYKLKDGTNGEDYGLFRYASGLTDYNQAKPSFFAMRTLNQQVGGANPVGLLDLVPPQVIFDFERFGTWQRGNQPHGTFTQSSAQQRSGSYSGQLSYNFPATGDRYVVFNAGSRPSLPNNATSLGIWVYGDGGGNALKVWLRGAGGEVLQYRLGYVGAPGWQFLSTSIIGNVESYNRISGNRSTLSFPASLQAIVLDNEGSPVRSGTIYLDDISALSGPEAHGVRFNRPDGQVVDVLWAPTVTQVSVPSASAQAVLVDLWGSESSLSAQGGMLTLGVGPNPFFLTHRPGTAQPAPQPPAPQPTAPPAPQPPAPQPPSTVGERCFPETGYCISGRIREFWEQNGGLPVFGYPKTPQREEEIEGRRLQVQWFERNRLELHPANPRPYDVLLGRLGADRLEQQQRDWTQFPKVAGDASCLSFEQTGQSICGDILTMWRANGLELDGLPGKTIDENLALFGLPISPPQVERLSDGREYTVQWFERARFELHPQNEPPFHVQLGLLGNEILAE
ncbi:glycosyl hydrolase [Candidatus Viridilinea mediisalina]|uniref:Asl1-like glycosyl hydrolase catalytic domain-containing protein n=1 Tax=Candidatus Viridilinea mediisalina TaxID=2024553 RepID=A0A2A6RNG4_9CHLR|nr:glycosyl hydrolase [Candidatus Viridilinea mediisalina]PDW04428.1 hypothetical protein CJ255_03315 [Candidatus Viridilinea mediisalina]